jgi:hypothetical protein
MISFVVYNIFKSALTPVNASNSNYGVFSSIYSDIMLHDNNILYPNIT